MTFHNQFQHRCAFCNSRSHTHTHCNSNMKGRMKLLVNLSNFMMDDTIPDFKSFPINELRCIVMGYTDHIRQIDFNGHPLLDRSQIKMLRGSIPFTLPKTKMIYKLTCIWNIYSVIRDAHHTMSEPIDDDCPICMESMTTHICHIWNSRYLVWDAVAANDRCNILTKCGHQFCGSCWEIQCTINIRRDHMTGLKYISCPLCRHQLQFPVGQ
jgi:hypothetical protein